MARDSGASLRVASNTFYSVHPLFALVIVTAVKVTKYMRRVHTLIAVIAEATVK